MRDNQHQVELASLVDKLLGDLLESGFTSEEFDPSEHPKPKSVHGLYIHGNIGCGKTMMLNIFYDQCLEMDIPCRRVHFHEFILDVHVQLHRLRKEFGSIPDLMDKVADYYFSQTPVFAFD